MTSECRAGGDPEQCWVWLKQNTEKKRSARKEAKTEMEASEGDTGQSQRALLAPPQIRVPPWGRGIKTC